MPYPLYTPGRKNTGNYWYFFNFFLKNFYNKTYRYISMPKRKQQAPTKGSEITSNIDKENEFLTEEEYRKKFEPVAPWKRKNIPDYGPLQDQQHWFIFFLVGVVITFIFEFTE
jgi:hypothetical protein